MAPKTDKNQGVGPNPLTQMRRKSVASKEYNLPSTHFNSMTNKSLLLRQPGKVALELGMNPLHFILLLIMSSSQKVQMIHHCFMTRKNNNRVHQSSPESQVI
jgi:hypothetical protein